MFIERDNNNQVFHIIYLIRYKFDWIITRNTSHQLPNEIGCHNNTTYIKSVTKRVIYWTG